MICKITKSYRKTIFSNIKEEKVFQTNELVRRKQIAKLFKYF